MYTLSLNTHVPASHYGEKGSHLSEMKRAGFPVPDGFVISKQAFDKFYIGNDDINELIVEIKRELSQINAEKYIVRSSAIGEDSSENSFAGQLDSFVSDCNIEEIIVNLKKCWASYDKENVKAYQALSGKKLMGMGVVIQNLIEPDYAGVIFTRSHIKVGHMLVEYVEGHGEKLVSGEVTPKSFHYNHTSKILEKDYLEALETGLVLAEKIEQFYSSPTDIEWVLKKSKFYVVQARPISTKIKERDIFWSNTNVNENYPDPITPLLYSIARQSYYHYFKNLSKLFAVSDKEIKNLEAEFSNVIGIFGCKMYYNMSSIHQILSSSPFSTTLIKSFDNFVGYSKGTESQKYKAGLFTKISFLREFIRKNNGLNKSVIAFEAIVDNYAQQANGAVVREEIRSCFHGFIEIRMHSWYHASLADFFAMTYHGLIGRFCTKYYGVEAPGVQNKLIQAIPDLVSTKPVIEMYKIVLLLRSHREALTCFKEGNPKTFWEWIQSNQNAKPIFNAITDYLSNWGFRCSGELMLTSTTYIEDPEKFISLLMQYEMLPEQDPEKIITNKYIESKQAKKDFIKLIIRKNGLFFPKTIFHVIILNHLVKRASAGISSRERVRLKQALLYFKFKNILKRVEKNFIGSGLLKNEGDIFFLTQTEVSENLDASHILHKTISSEIELRKNLFKSESQLKYPDDFYTSRGEYLSPEKVSKKDSDNKTVGVLKGLCACGGSITGTVKVLDSVLQAGKLERGDILVTKQTDPGWVVVFPLISGLIVERGGMLSHGAIVSREFGIPAIVGVDLATSLLKDGDKIILNADKGEALFCE